MMKLSKKDYLFGRTCKVQADTGPGSVSAAYDWVDPINTAMGTSGLTPSCFIAALVIDHFIPIPDDDRDIDIPDNFWDWTDVRDLFKSCQSAWWRGRLGEGLPEVEAHARGALMTEELKETT